MKPKEAIKTIKIALAEVEWNYPMDYTVAFEEAIKALEKQIPKKPVDNPENGWFECPNCGLIVWVYYGTGETHHCDCGQRLDWEGIEGRMKK